MSENISDVNKDFNIDEIIWRESNSLMVQHTVKEMLHFALFVSSRFNSNWNTKKTNLIFDDKISKSHSLVIQELYTVWYHKYKKDGNINNTDEGLDKDKD